MGDGGGAQTGLVGEHAPGEAVLHGQHDGVAKDAAAHGLKAEGAGEDGAQHAGDVGNAHEDDHNARRHIEHGHEGDQQGGDLTDALYAADDHNGHHHGKDDAACQGGNAEQAVESAGDLAGLGDVADAEGGQAAQDGEDDGQPLPVFAQAVLNVVHRAALMDALPVGVAELHGQGNLGVFGAHAEEGGHPHPEHGARSADKDSPGNAGDVAGAHGARQGGGHRLEGGQVAAVVALALFAEQGAHGVPHDIAEPADLDPAGAEGEEHAGAHQQDQHDGAPDEVVDLAVDQRDSLKESFHRSSLL